jgi:hypothetical protein
MVAVDMLRSQASWFQVITMASVTERANKMSGVRCLLSQNLLPSSFTMSGMLQRCRQQLHPHTKIPLMMMSCHCIATECCQLFYTTNKATSAGHTCPFCAGGSCLLHNEGMLPDTLYQYNPITQYRFPLPTHSSMLCSQYLISFFSFPIARALVRARVHLQVFLSTFFDFDTVTKRWECVSETRSKGPVIQIPQVTFERRVDQPLIVFFW